MLSLYYGQWDYWEVRDKVTFDYFKKLIIVNDGVTEIDIKRDVYSAWKRWGAVNNNSRIGRVIRVIGGDATTGAFKAGDIYFLVNGWRLQVDLSVTSIIGSLFSDDFDTALIDPEGNSVFQSFVSNLVTGVNSTVSVDTSAIAQAVWLLQSAGAGISYGDLIDRIDKNTKLDLNLTL